MLKTKIIMNNNTKMNEITLIARAIKEENRSNKRLNSQCDRIEQLLNSSQEKIKYREIMSLGFKEQIEDGDKAYFNEFGYDYAIITKKLTKHIYLEWAKETQLCEIIRIDSPKSCNIKARMPIKNLTHLKRIIDFFSDNKDVKNKEIQQVLPDIMGSILGTKKMVVICKDCQEKYGNKTKLITNELGFRHCEHIKHRQFIDSNGVKTSVWE